MFLCQHGPTSTGQMLVEDNIAHFYLHLSAKSGIQHRHPMYKRLGGPQSPSRRLLIISRLPGFEPWTVQPVASRYVDWATPSLKKMV